MRLREWVEKLGRPTETTVPVNLKIKNEETEDMRKEDIREIEIRINMLQEEAAVILRR